MSSASRRGEQAAPTKEEARPERGLAGRIWEQFGTLAMAIAIALSIRAFVIEPYRIPSGSMFPTLLIGDHLFVNKFIYGIKVPFTRYRLPALREPARGDVVVFTVAKGRYDDIYPADQRPDLPRDRFVKRIIGLPGDTVEVQDGAVWINGKRVPTEATGRTFEDDHGRELLEEEEELPGRPHEVLDDPGVTGLNLAPTRIPEGRYLMMGDNRDWSNDSRRWGTVALADLKGPAFVIYWSWNWDGSWGELLSPLTWWDLLAHRTRWGRIGEGIR
jgi:signal peptidase I